jgi:hypothetical protein
MTQWDGDSLFRYQLIEIAKQHPEAACRILRRVLGFVLDRMRAAVQDSEVPSLSNIFHEFHDNETHGLKLDDEVLKTLAEAVPATFLEAVWGFFVDVLPLGQRPYETDNPFYFPSDAFRDTGAFGRRGVS